MFMFGAPCVCVGVPVQVQFADYGTESIIDASHLFALTPQFCNLSRQGVRCRVATAAEAGGGVEMPAGVMSRASLSDVLLNKLVVVRVMSMTDEDTCRVTFPLCEHNQQQIPQLSRLPSSSLYNTGKMIRIKSTHLSRLRVWLSPSALVY